MEKFEIGRLFVTCGVQELMDSDMAFRSFVAQSVRRYQNLDWGDISLEDKEQNDAGAADGEGFMLAAYHKDDRKLWIITDRGHLTTTVLFPEEY